MSTSTTKEHLSRRYITEPGTTIPFDVLRTPGAYICNWSGHLLRVKKEAVAVGHLPALNMVGLEPLTVTKISDNPDVPLAAAKRLAANFEISANF